MADIPEDRVPGSGIVNTEECLNILRDIVANADNSNYLRRHLHEPFKGESYLAPHKCDVPAELIEGAMKALGLPYPKAPKPRRVPDIPTPAQATVLESLATDGARLVTWYSRQRSGAYLLSPAGERQDTVREPTVCALRDFGWIEQVKDNPWGDKFHAITQAGQDALTRKTQRASAGLGKPNQP